MLKLYHADMSTCAQKVRIALDEKGLKWDSHLFNLRKSDQHKPEYLILNPKGVEPTLVDNERIVIESTIICEYLEDAYPHPQLSPATSKDRAQMRIWTKRLDEVLHFYTGVLSGSVAFRHQHLARSQQELDAYLEGIPDPQRRERQRTQIKLGMEAPQFSKAILVFDQFLPDLETQLCKTKWMVENQYSLAEVNYTPYLIRLDELQLWEWMDQRPRIKKLYERIKTRPSYKSAYLDWKNDSYCSLMATKGAEAWPKIKKIISN